MSDAEYLRKGCCCRMARQPGTPRGTEPPLCNRNPAWEIRRIGNFCTFHFDRFMETHEVDIDNIVRLTDKDSAFVVRCEPGKDRNGNHAPLNGRRAQRATG